MPRRQLRAEAGQTAINSFARLTKPSLPVSEPAGKPSSGLKRKAEDDTIQQVAPKTPRTGKRAVPSPLHLRGESAVTPAGPQTAAETPTRALGGAMKRMRLAPSSASATSRKRTAAAPRAKSSRAAVHSPLSSPSPVRTSPVSGIFAELGADDLPEPLEDMLRMISSVLTSLSMHYAHAGCTSAALAIEIMGAATQMWGRRQVTLEDIQLALGILSEGSDASEDQQSLKMFSYGVRGDIALNNIFIELHHPERGVRKSLLEEAEMVRRVKKCVSARWSDYQRQAGCFAKLDRFIQLLPRYKITISASVAQSSAAARARKGQAALDTIQAARPSAPAEKAVGPAAASPAAAGDGAEVASLEDRQAMLRQRIEARNALAAAAAAASGGALDPAAKARKSALAYVPHVLRTIRMLLTRAAGSVQSLTERAPVARPTTFTLSQLRMSASATGRVPSSQVEPAIQILAELSAGYVKLRRWQGVVAIVVSGLEPTSAEVSSWS